MKTGNLQPPKSMGGQSQHNNEQVLRRETRGVKSELDQEQSQDAVDEGEPARETGKTDPRQNQGNWRGHHQDE